MFEQFAAVEPDQVRLVLVGQDPRAVERLGYDMYRLARHENGWAYQLLNEAPGGKVLVDM